MSGLRGPDEHRSSMGTTLASGPFMELSKIFSNRKVLCHWTFNGMGYLEKVDIIWERVL